MKSFDSLDVRKVENGYIVCVHNEGGSHEYIFETLRRAMKFLKDTLEGKSSGTSAE